VVPAGFSPDVWFVKFQQRVKYIFQGASLAEWLKLLTSNYLPLTAVGSNPDRDFGFFHVRKLSS
jgi:hypothetical protein